jgi:hypothetical protein
MAEAGRLWGGTCVQRFAESGLGPLEIAVMRMLIGWILLPHMYKHMVADITATSARTNSNVPTVAAPPPLLCSFAAGAQQAEINPDTWTSSLTSRTSSFYVTIPPSHLMMGIDWLFGSNGGRVDLSLGLF